MIGASSALPSREEIIAYITQVARAKGIDPQTFLAVVNGESGFNPAAVGDQGKAHGLGQYHDDYLAKDYEKATGFQTDDPSAWKSQIDDMANRVIAPGGGGWTPWHAARNAGIAPNQGLPGGPAGGVSAPVTASRGRAGQPVTAQATPGQGGGLASMFGMTPEEWQDATDPRGDQTLGGKAASGIASLFGHPGRSNLRASEKSQTLGQMLLGGPSEKDKAAEAAVEGYNEFAPVGRQAQIDALAKKKHPTVGSSLMGMVTGTQPAQPGLPVKKPGGLFSMLFG